MGLTYKLEKGLKKVVKNVFSKTVQNRIKIIWNAKNFIFPQILAILGDGWVCLTKSGEFEIYFSLTLFRY